MHLRMFDGAKIAHQKAITSDDIIARERSPARYEKLERKL